MKIDPYKHKERYLSWKQKVLNEGIPEVSKANSKHILNYVFDMELGLNVSKINKKGARSYPRLNNIRQRMIFLIKTFEQLFSLRDITKLTEIQLFQFFANMRNGEFKTKTGQTYKSTADYVKVFKAFWHWYMKVQKKKGKYIIDITEDLDSTRPKPKWVHLEEDEIKKLTDNAKYEYKILIWFLIYTGIRAPTELMNVRVCDFYNDFKEFKIWDEVSKTFEREIKLMDFSTEIKKFIENKNLQPTDQVFPICPPVVNKYLQRLAKRLFGDGITKAGDKYSNLTMYDFRHISCCFWARRYKDDLGMKLRFGWTDSKKIYYYSEFLGQKDSIKEEDMLIDVKKPEIEKRLIKTENENTQLKDEVKYLKDMINEIGENTTKLKQRMKVLEMKTCT